MKNKSLGHKIYLLFVVLCGWAITGFIGYKLYLEYESRKWESTKGKITAVQIEHRTYENAGTKYMYFGKVQYLYQVNEEEFVGSKLAINPLKMRTESGMQSELLKYGIELNKEVPVYFKESNPQNAVLIIGPTRSTALVWVAFIFFLFCSVSGIFVLLGKL